MHPGHIYVSLVHNVAIFELLWCVTLPELHLAYRPLFTKLFQFLTLSECPPACHLCGCARAPWPADMQFAGPRMGSTVCWLSKSDMSCL